MLAVILAAAIACAPAPRIQWTIDDGPHPVRTPAFLRLLKQHRVKATFYVVGANLWHHRGLVREISAAGHRFGNHAWSHRKPCKMKARGLVREVMRTARMLDKILGTRAKDGWRYRPPFGHRCHIRSLRKRGYTIRLWDYGDIPNRPAKMWKVAQRELSKGRSPVLLFHYPSRMAPVLRLAAKHGYLKGRSPRTRP